MTYILFNGNNEIIGFSDSKATDDYVESDRDIVSVGNKFFYADEIESIRQAKAEEEAEAKRMAKLPTLQDRINDLELALIEMAGE